MVVSALAKYGMMIAAKMIVAMRSNHSQVIVENNILVGFSNLLREMLVLATQIMDVHFLFHVNNSRSVILIRWM